MEDQDKKDSEIPKIFDNACSTRSASELVLHMTQDILYIFRA